MKKALLIAFVCLLFGACKPALTPDEKQLCGRWVTTGQEYNREWFTFKPDGTFIDIRFSFNPGMYHAETFAIKDSLLLLKYRSFIIFHSTTRYRIINKTDSTIVIASPGTKKYPSETYYLKKMKLNGKFIVV